MNQSIENEKNVTQTEKTDNQSSNSRSKRGPRKKNTSQTDRTAKSSGPCAVAESGQQNQAESSMKKKSRSRKHNEQRPTTSLNPGAVPWQPPPPCYPTSGSNDPALACSISDRKPSGADHPTGSGRGKRPASKGRGGGNKPFKHKYSTTKSTGAMTAPDSTPAGTAASASFSGPKPDHITPMACTPEDDRENSDGEEVCILCANPLKFVSVAPCGHSTCSLCAARLRLKAQDKHCVVCKRLADFTIVYPFNPTDGFRSFASFGIADEDALPIPGVVAEYRSQMLFVDCPEHSRTMDGLTSMSCTICSQRCGSEKALFKHVKVAHNKQFCTLCFANRPLFPCEQQPMTAMELKTHINAPPGALVGSGGDKSGGHPPCHFCTTHFFDAQALYVHMRDQHFTCHLCPAQFQQRFYRAVPQLIAHLRHSHYTCSLCLDSRPLGALGDGAHIVAYARRAEYAEHLRSAHNISSSSGSGRGMSSDHPLSLSQALSTAFPIAGSRHHQAAVSRGDGDDMGGVEGESQSVDYLDLNMTSADPYSQTNAREGVADQHHQQYRHRQHQQVARQGGRWTAAGGFVPDHMRVLGRVTGTGRFYEEEEGTDESRKGVREASVKDMKGGRSSTTVRGTDWTGRSAIGESDFPALEASAPPRAAAAPGDPPSRNHHPLSVVPSQSEKQRAVRAKAIVEEQQKQRERELAVRRGQRNLALAQALGLDTMALADAVKATAAAAPGHRGSSDWTQGEGLDGSVLRILTNCPLFARMTMTDGERSQSGGVSLRRPLYPVGLQEWAREFRADLLKTEKRLYDMLADPHCNSCQLKPMRGWSRESISLLAKYYAVNAQEYGDLQGRRYLSLVKTADSVLPALPLSSAVMRTVIVPASGLNTAVELVELSRAMDRVAEGEALPLLHFLLLKTGAGTTLGDFLCMIKTASENAYSRPGAATSAASMNGHILDIHCIGHALVRVRLSSIQAAYALVIACLASPELMSRFQVQQSFSEEHVLDLPDLPLAGGDQSAEYRGVEPDQDLDWVRVPREEVESVPEIVGEGAWDDDVPASSSQWERGVPTKPAPPGQQTEAAKASAADKFNSAFKHAIGKDKPPPILPTAAPAGTGGNSGQVAVADGPKSLDANRPSGKARSGVAGAVRNAFSALLLDDDGDDDNDDDGDNEWDRDDEITGERTTDDDDGVM